MFDALYGESGYYSQGTVKFGARGDFFTASQIHELFGQVLAREFERQWLREGSPSRFTILELGPGNGEFAFDAVNYIRATNPQFYDCLAYICCEVSPPLARIQQATAAVSLKGRLAGLRTLPELAPFQCGVIFSNEFFDSLASSCRTSKLRTTSGIVRRKAELAGRRTLRRTTSRCVGTRRSAVGRRPARRDFS